MSLRTLEVSRPWREWQHAGRKLLSTLRILFTLGMARTFGHYRHSEWNGELDYAIYEWRGKMWAIPTGPFDDEARFRRS